MKNHSPKKIFAVIKFKNITVLFCFLFVLIFSSAVYFLFNMNWTEASSSVKTLPTVIVDAGHGGEDGGAVAVDNTNEKDYNLEIALKLEQILKLNGFRVIMTRTTDTMTCDDGLNTIRSRKVSDIKNRFKIIEENPDAVFVSIHQNKFPDASQHGTQVFYAGNNPQSKVLADMIQQTVVNGLQPENKRVTKKSGKEIYVLYHANSTAVLVECGFISNYSDLQKLKSDDYKTQMAMLIADGIIKYNLMGD